MTDHVTNLSNGMITAVGQDLTTEVLKTPECHQAVRWSADHIAKGGAAAVGFVVAAAPVVLPIALAGGAIAGMFAFLNWLDKPKPAAPAPADPR